LSATSELDRRKGPTLPSAIYRPCPAIAPPAEATRPASRNDTGRESQYGPSPCGRKRSQAAAGPLFAVNRELGASAEKGDAGHGIACATHGSAGEDAAGSR
jgi:hypothetical protein